MISSQKIQLKTFEDMIPVARALKINLSDGIQGLLQALGKEAGDDPIEFIEGHKNTAINRISIEASDESYVIYLGNESFSVEKNLLTAVQKLMLYNYIFVSDKKFPKDCLGLFQAFSNIFGWKLTTENKRITSLLRS